MSTDNELSGFDTIVGTLGFVGLMTMLFCVFLAAAGDGLDGSPYLSYFSGLGIAMFCSAGVMTWLHPEDGRGK